MMRARLAIAALLCLGATAASSQSAPVSQYTRLSLTPPQCVQAKGPAEGFACAGLAGWTLNIGYPAFGATLAFVRGKRPASALTPTAGKLVSIDGLVGKTSNVEWRGVTRNGAFEPYAAILRVLVLDASQRQEMIESGAPSPDMKRAQILVVTHLGREGACVVAYVDAQANPKPNDLAREAADASASGVTCPVARVDIRGARTPALTSYLD